MTGQPRSNPLCATFAESRPICLLYSFFIKVFLNESLGRKFITFLQVVVKMLSSQFNTFPYIPFHCIIELIYSPIRQTQTEKYRYIQRNYYYYARCTSMKWTLQCDGRSYDVVVSPLNNSMYSILSCFYWCTKCLKSPPRIAEVTVKNEVARFLWTAAYIHTALACARVCTRAWWIFIGSRQSRQSRWSAGTWHPAMTCPVRRSPVCFAVFPATNPFTFLSESTSSKCVPWPSLPHNENAFDIVAVFGNKVERCFDIVAGVDRVLHLLIIFTKTFAPL